MDGQPVSPLETVNVFVAVPMPQDCLQLISKVDPRVNLIYDEALIPKQRYKADRKGEHLEFTSEMEERWLCYLRTAHVMFGFDPRHMKDLRQVAPLLKWVQGTSTGIGPVVAECGWAQHGIVTTSASGVHSVPLAEFVTLAMLYFTKDVPHLHSLKQQSRFERYCTAQLRGKTLGVVGVGSVGTEVARQA